MTAFLLAALMASAQPLPPIKVEVVAGKGFAATVMKIDANQYDAVVDRIKILAEQRCGTKKARLGRYFFDNQIDVERGVTIIRDFRQAFSCYDPATDPYKPVPADWKASAAETEAATRFAQRFVDNLDAGNTMILNKMLDPALEVTPTEMKRFIDEAKVYQTGAGEFSPRLDGWLNNPEGASYPGAYAYFAVLSTHPGIVGTCGGILLYRLREGEYQISQYDVRYISQRLVDEEGFSDEELDRLCKR